MIDLLPQPDGVILPVQARPGAKKNEVRGEQNGALKVFVTQVPEKGKANKMIVEILAKSLKLKKSQIELVCGDTSPQKVLVTGISPTNCPKRSRRSFEVCLPVGISAPLFLPAPLLRVFLFRSDRPLSFAGTPFCGKLG